MKHGPIALVDESTIVVASATQKSLYDKIASNIEEVKSRICTTLVITQKSCTRFKNEDEKVIYDEVVKIPDTEDAFAPVLSVIPAQLLAYYCAVHRGMNPDKPRNLAKSVTVE